jgi:hypothetical protein
VVRIDFKAGNDDVYVYRNPTSSTEPGTPTLKRLAAADMSFNGISFGAFLNGRTVTHDEVRVGRSWAEAIGVSPFAAWNVSKGLDGSPGKDPAFGADPDGDSVPNGLEWILGGNPLARDLSALISLDTTDGLTLAFTRDEASLGVASLAVQWATDLAGNWSDIPVSQSGGIYLNGVSVSVDESTLPDAVTVRIPSAIAPDGRLFVRLKAVLLAP